MSRAAIALLTGAWRRPFRARQIRGVPGLYWEVSGPRAAREAQARAEVRQELAQEPDRCWICHYRFLHGNCSASLRRYGRSGGREHHLRLQEYTAAIGELARLGRAKCRCKPAQQTPRAFTRLVQVPRDPVPGADPRRPAPQPGGPRRPAFGSRLIVVVPARA